MEKIEVSLYLGHRFIKIEPGDNGDLNIRYVEGSFDANEQNAVTAIMNTLVALSNGKKIDQYFNPTRDEIDDEKVVKCEWMRSGRLRLHGEANKNFNFCNTTFAALQKHRVFTCPKRVYHQLPDRRQKDAEKEQRQESTTD